MEHENNKMGRWIYCRLMKRFKWTVLALEQVKESLTHIGGDDEHKRDGHYLVRLRKKRGYLPRELDSLIAFSFYNLSAKVSELEMRKIINVMCYDHDDHAAKQCLAKLGKLYGRFAIDFDVEASSTRLLARRAGRRYGGGWLTRKEEEALFSYITTRAARFSINMSALEQLQRYNVNNQLYEYVIATASVTEKIESLWRTQEAAGALGMEFSVKSD